MTEAHRLEQLAAQYALPAGCTAALDRLLALVAEDPAAATTVRDPAVAVDAHVADALVALELAPASAARRVADLGTGAGFPGLVLAAALPAAEVALVESNRRKCEFLARAAAEMRLDNVLVVPARAESWSDGLATRDLVTARAVAPLAVLVEYAAPLLVAGGALLAWKGARDEREEADGAAAAAATGLEPADVLAVHPWAEAERLHLHLYV